MIMAFPGHHLFCFLRSNKALPVADTVYNRAKIIIVYSLMGFARKGHRDFQLILVYSWTRPATLVADKGRGGMFLFLLFLHFHPLSLSFISSRNSSISLLPFSGRRHKMTHKGWRVAKPQHNQFESRKGPLCNLRIMQALIWGFVVRLQDQWKLS